MGYESFSMFDYLCRRYRCLSPFGGRLPRLQPLDHGPHRRVVFHRTVRVSERFPRAGFLAKGPVGSADHRHTGIVRRYDCKSLAGLGRLGLHEPTLSLSRSDFPGLFPDLVRSLQHLLLDRREYLQKRKKRVNAYRRVIPFSKNERTICRTLIPGFRASKGS